MHDLLVVGGGPAGLAVAVGGARAGLDVALCERRPGPIDKACGEGLMPSALAALRRLGIDPAGAPIRGIRYLDATRSVTATFSAGPGRGVRRTTLQAAMRAAAVAAGVELHQLSVGEVVQYAGHVEAAGLRARYLIAADGLHSPIRTALGLHRPSRGPSRWGLRRHYRLGADRDPPGDLVEVHWAAHSEAYVTPVAGDTVGVAVLSSVRGPFEAQLRQFPALARRLSDAEPASDVRGAGPLRQRTGGRASSRVLLVGDAAGYVDALTGEGIAISLATAAVLVQCLMDGRPDRYDRAWLRASRRTRLLTNALLWARHQPRLARAIVPLAARVPSLYGRAVDQLAG